MDFRYSAYVEAAQATVEHGVRKGRIDVFQWCNILLLEQGQIRSGKNYGHRF